ncbi:MAG: S8 family serine peptidase [Pseudomonadota bacterium]|nr:S8 family serine peptidase [Pseudomonadota bacterium]
MLSHRTHLIAAGFGVVAALASVALAAPSTAPAVALTAKQASLLGAPVAARPAREQRVSKLIVKMRAAGSSDLVRPLMATHARDFAATAGLRIKSVRNTGGDASLVVLETPLSLTEAKALAARIAADPAVEYAEPDLIMKSMATPNETDFAAKQWNLFAPATSYTGRVIVPMGEPAKNTVAPATGGANLPTAWDRTTGVAAVVIAIVDTGIVNHPDLNNAGLAALNTYTPGGRFLLGYDFVSDDALGLPLNFVSNDGNGRDNDPADPGDAVNAGEKTANPVACDDNGDAQNRDSPSSWHGTVSAGLAAATANNTVGIAGIGWDVRVLPVRALGKCGGDMSDMADAIRWAAGLPVTDIPAIPNNLNPAKIISVGAGTLPGTTCSMTLQSAIDAAIAAGSVIVAATGNHGEFSISSPANCNGVIAVTAHAINGENASYSNIGPVGGAGTQPTISAAGGGSPASLGALGPIDNVAWDGFYVWSTTPTGNGGPQTPLIYKGITGTSASAAQVAGVAALIKSLRPEATPAMTRSAIVTSARPFPELSSCAAGRVWAGQCGVGMLDATRALQAAGPPVIVTAPRAATVAAGATVSFTVEAIGVIGYQWTRAGVNIAGATGPSYTTPALAATDNNVGYAVVMSNLFGTSVSPAAVVTVNSPSSNSPSGGGALPLWQLLLMSSLLLAGRVRISHREQ